MAKYITIVNQPGFLPENDPREHSTWAGACEGLATELANSQEVADTDADYAEYEDLMAEARSFIDLTPRLPLVVGPCPMGYVYEIQKGA